MILPFLGLSPLELLSLRILHVREKWRTWQGCLFFRPAPWNYNTFAWNKEIRKLGHSDLNAANMTTHHIHIFSHVLDAFSLKFRSCFSVQNIPVQEPIPLQNAVVKWYTGWKLQTNHISDAVRQWNKKNTNRGLSIISFPSLTILAASFFSLL